MRNHFDRQLDRLHIELTTMGGLCEQAIAVVAKAMLDRDASLLPQAYVIEHKIDRSEREIEGMCMNLLLCQQPVAGDLRRVSSTLKVITDLERIGDHAADIAEIMPHLFDSRKAGDPAVSQAISMGQKAHKMVVDALDAFLKEDMNAAQQVIAADDEVDYDFNAIKRTLAEEIAADPTQVDAALDLLMIIKYLERIGDHAVNVAEWVQFTRTGLYKNESLF